MKCPKCGSEEGYSLDIKVQVWQRAKGEFDEEQGVFFAAEFENLYDTEQELGRELVCRVCSDPNSIVVKEVVWT